MKNTKLEGLALLNALPKAIIKKMLEYQVTQGNEKDISKFENNGVTANKLSGGFNWIDTVEGYDFWCRILINHKYDDFYKLYDLGIKDAMDEDLVQELRDRGYEVSAKKTITTEISI